MKNRHPFNRKKARTLSAFFCLMTLMILFNNCSGTGFGTEVAELSSVVLGDPGDLQPAPTTSTTLPNANPIPTPSPPVASACTQASMRKVSVNSVSTMTAAISKAIPGDSIEIQPGTYRLQTALSMGASGTASLPICLRAAQANTVTLESESASYMAIRISGTYWTLENLTIKGVCASDDLCEHAIQIKEAAHNTVIRNNTFTDFNAQIKGSSSGTQASDNVLIEGNHFFDSRPRQTSKPTTKIDVVGGKYWIIRGNFIHDFQKSQGDTISYAAFLKGYSRYGTFENNVVACSLNFSGGVRIGLSFGGGTTGPQYCWDYDPATGKGCAFEHEFGLMRNNLILNCSDVGIFIRDTNKSLITNNLVIDTAGIDSLLDAGRPVPTSEVSRNIVQGQIRDRNGAISIRKNNLVTTDRTTLSSWFQNMDQYNYTYVNSATLKDITSPIPEVTTDMCGELRTGNLDLGPFEFQNTSCFQDIMDLINSNKR
ncbi:MAG: chondroitinase-B domain-containing protein [Pseudobdellovibrionaceae bacterium]